jgi:hypothetical protein
MSLPTTRSTTLMLVLELGLRLFSSQDLEGTSLQGESCATTASDGSRPPHPSLPPGPRPPMTPEDVLARYCINSCSVAFRRSAIPELPDWYYSADLADWALSVLLGTRGTAGYLDEAMAAYRIHARGVWSGVTHRQRIEARLAFFDRLGADFRRHHAGAVRGGRAQAHLDLALAWEAEGKSISAASHVLQSLWQSPGDRSLSSAARLRVLARVFLPGLGRRVPAQRAPGT